MGDTFICAAVYLEDVDKSRAATDIDPATFGIDKDIVRIAAGVDTGNDCAVRACKHRELRRVARYD
jgi:hypothetical protein